jgi:Kef-type K+ transport system membrane component KefB
LIKARELRTTLPETKPFTIKHYLPYLAVLLLFGVGIWLILSTGSRLYSQPETPASSVESAQMSSSPSVSPQSVSGRSYASRIFHENLRNSLSILLLQLVVIIVAARLVGRLFRKIGQPPVLGEIVAGIVLGPSLLGWLSPPTMAFLFPAASMETLKLLSQIGVALFMFVVGMELDVQHLRKKAHTAVMVSNASIIVPFFLGVSLSLLLYRSLAPAGKSFTAFALFMGIAMSITAFPVLARILEDRGMSKTYLGSIALTCAAVDDVTAWCMLALVIAVAQSGSMAASFLTVAFALAFIAFMLLLVKPQFARLLATRANSGEYSRSVVAGILAFVFASALMTEAIGIHALFGAFLAGVVMPSTGGLRELLKERIGTFSAVALLPLFFAFTGLRMQVNLLNDWHSWIMCAVIVVVAIAGKLGASMLMARWTGMNWRDSFSLGVLMNTRGLVELIVLNIGYDLGILSARAFAMLVLMALITTFMTGPMLALVRSDQSRKVHTHV